MTRGHIQEIWITINGLRRLERLNHRKAEFLQFLKISFSTFHWGEISFSNFLEGWKLSFYMSHGGRAITRKCCPQKLYRNCPGLCRWEAGKQKKVLEDGDFSPRFKIRQKFGTWTKSLPLCPSSCFPVSMGKSLSLFIVPSCNIYPPVRTLTVRTPVRAGAEQLHIWGRKRNSFVEHPPSELNCCRPFTRMTLFTLHTTLWFFTHFTGEEVMPH